MANKLLLLLILLAACSPAKKAQKYNEDVKRGIASYIDQHPCVNDTVTQTKSDTVTQTEIVADTAYIQVNDTVTQVVTQTKTVTRIIKDTITKVVTDNQLVNYWKDSANGAVRSNIALQSDLSKKSIELSDAKNKAALRLYFLIGAIACFSIWIFRKQIFKLIA